MSNKPLIRSIPSRYDDQTVIGWARTDTSESGRYYSGGYCYTDIRLKLEDGTSRYVTLEEKNR